jgi:hypothetical protein
VISAEAFSFYNQLVYDKDWIDMPVAKLIKLFAIYKQRGVMDVCPQ